MPVRSLFSADFLQAFLSPKPCCTNAYPFQPTFSAAVPAPLPSTSPHRFFE
ncbi:hypothetical protein CLOSTMETH_01273 [[Clostridium] methylpentosum DSM 5476]|uniref:Uncharacterized protein n=1 Tax=[Clostridium] methylpentosum DSM 5476 TaxID=537013 RepID=C0EBQ5_9FIRM|nr:hypothetical protein CLOSTMETH_01273 [[Clostridium] methylpentosum DSM 5476]